MHSNSLRTYSNYSQKAVNLLGEMILLHRKKRKMTTQDLADRAGISRTTLYKIEKGDMKCEIGLVFEVAVLVGIKLFETRLTTIDSLHESIENKIALLPDRIRKLKGRLEDEF